MADANSTPVPGYHPHDPAPNPFIETGPTQDIECTLCNVSDGLRMIQRALTSEGDELQFCESELRGMITTIDGMYSALGEAISRVDELRQGVS